MEASSRNLGGMTSSSLCRPSLQREQKGRTTIVVTLEIKHFARLVRSIALCQPLKNSSINLVEALSQYEGRLLRKAEQFEDVVSESIMEHKPVNAKSICYWLAFDVMGEFAVGKSFNMLETKDWHQIIHVLRRAMSVLGPLSAKPWLAILGRSLFPWLWRMRDFNQFIDFCKESMKERIEVSHRRL